MTATNPRTRTLSRWACIAGLTGLLALAGCKTRGDGGSGGGSVGKRSDPLVYNGPGARIPPQNVPLPERGGVGSKGRDPLTAPVGKAGDKTGVGYIDDPGRFKGNFNPGPGTTPAALAGKKNHGEELKIDTPDNRVPLRQTGAVLPASGAEVVEGVELLFAELAKYGVNRENRSLTREGEQYTFRASVPISGNGARRGYTGEGKTANDAVKAVLDQVKADRR